MTEAIIEFLKGLADEDDAKRKRVALVVCGAAVVFALFAHNEVYDALAGPFAIDVKEAAALQAAPHFGSYVTLTRGGKPVEVSELQGLPVREVEIHLHGGARITTSAHWSAVDAGGVRIAVKRPVGERSTRVEGRLRAPTASEAGRLPTKAALVLDATASYSFWLLGALAAAFAFGFAGWVYFRGDGPARSESLSILQR